MEIFTRTTPHHRRFSRPKSAHRSRLRKTRRSSARRPSRMNQREACAMPSIRTRTSTSAPTSRAPHILRRLPPPRRRNLVFASTSSVYGANTQNCRYTEHPTDTEHLTNTHATKKSVRDDGPQLRPSLRHSQQPGLDSSPSTKPLGPPGHGAVFIHQSHPRPANHGSTSLQPRANLIVAASPT